MDKIINKKLVFSIGLFAIQSLLFSCDDRPNDADYYFFNGELGKVEEGTIREDGTFCMETLIYSDVKKYEVYDDYILAYQVPCIDKDDYRDIVYPTYEDSIAWSHYDDSVNNLLDKVSKLHDCYWIIQKSTKKVYGPLSKKEYNRLCKELNVKKENDKFRHIRVYNVGR